MALVPRQIPKDTKSTFYGLFHLFDASARQGMPRSKNTQGRLPTEIYGLIIYHIHDLKSYRACATVSRIFRDLCQQHLMLMDDECFLPNEWTKTCGENGRVEEEEDEYETMVPKLKFHTYDKDTGKGEDLRITATEGPYHIAGFQYKGFTTRWKVMVGSERNRRSLLGGFAIGTNKR